MELLKLKLLPFNLPLNGRPSVINEEVLNDPFRFTGTMYCDPVMELSIPNFLLYLLRRLVLVPRCGISPESVVRWTNPKSWAGKTRELNGTRFR